MSTRNCAIAVRGMRAFQAAALAGLILAGCGKVSIPWVKPSSPAPPPASAPAPAATPQVRYFFHTVRYPGETLTIIAEWYANDPGLEKALLHANPGVGSGKIREGTRILIPEFLVVTRDPMPKEFVERYYRVPAKAPPPPPETPAARAGRQSFYSHTVQYSGETVSIIAAWYTGDKMNYKILAAANPEIKPHQIHVGMKILIPESMMVTREPMPKSFVDGFYPEPKKPQPDEEPTLIGPKPLN